MGKAWETKAFFFPSINKNWDTGAFVPGRPHKVLVGFSPIFSLIVLNPEGNRGQDRRGIKFCREREARELSFRGNWLLPDWQKENSS